MVGFLVGLGLEGELWTGDASFEIWDLYAVNSPGGIGTSGGYFDSDSFGTFDSAIIHSGNFDERTIVSGFDISQIDGQTNRTAILDGIVTWLLYGSPPEVIETIPFNNEFWVHLQQGVSVVYSQNMDTSDIPP